ncbi:hypothetical protein R3P38DRAFT_2790301 [Favolaschia claudopus]|uniref:Uncharacterized protein n=1 Tax=Favolaschia claudopus TaxID=2862362 RepID=A0AAW0AIP9_9AGAR
MIITLIPYATVVRRAPTAHPPLFPIRYWHRRRRREAGEEEWYQSFSLSSRVFVLSEKQESGKSAATRSQSSDRRPNQGAKPTPLEAGGAAWRCAWDGADSYGRGGRESWKARGESARQQRSGHFDVPHAACVEENLHFEGGANGWRGDLNACFAAVDAWTWANGTTSQMNPQRDDGTTSTVVSEYTAGLRWRHDHVHGTNVDTNIRSEGRQAATPSLI